MMKLTNPLPAWIDQSLFKVQTIKPVTSDNAVVGLRVCRGENWDKKNKLPQYAADQGGTGTGTVTEVGENGLTVVV
jgi:hypothetical protein